MSLNLDGVGVCYLLVGVGPAMSSSEVETTTKCTWQKGIVISVAFIELVIYNIASNVIIIYVAVFISIIYWILFVVFDCHIWCKFTEINRISSNAIAIKCYYSRVVVQITFNCDDTYINIGSYNM